MVNRTDWRTRLRELLIDAGEAGCKQVELVKRLQSWADAAAIEDHLRAWLAEQKVQEFNTGPSGRSGGRPATVWRATTLMLEDR